MHIICKRKELRFIINQLLHLCLIIFTPYAASLWCISTFSSSPFHIYSFHSIILPYFLFFSLVLPYLHLIQPYFIIFLLLRIRLIIFTPSKASFHHITTFASSLYHSYTNEATVLPYNFHFFYNKSSITDRAQQQSTLHKL